MINKRVMCVSCFIGMMNLSFGMSSSPRLSEEEKKTVQIFVTNKLPYEVVVRGVYIDKKYPLSVNLNKVKKTYVEFTVPAEGINFPVFFSHAKNGQRNKRLRLVKIEGIDPQNNTIVAQIFEWELVDSLFSMRITEKPGSQSVAQPSSSSDSSESSSLASIEEE